jgi:hypothetical protein
VPICIRWPGVIKPGTVYNDFFAHEDFIPTFAAAAGDTDIVQRLLKGTTLNGKQFKVHLDGYNLVPFFKGEVKESPRKEFLYWSDDGDLMAIRVNQWKIAFMQQQTEIGPRYPGGVWMGGFDQLRSPVLYNLQTNSTPALARSPNAAVSTLENFSLGRRKPPSGTSWRPSKCFRRRPRPQASPSATRWTRLCLQTRQAATNEHNWAYNRWSSRQRLGGCQHERRLKNSPLEMKRLCWRRTTLVGRERDSPFILTLLRS